ncbi:helix-turn-helix domain-containing protein [Flagellimonas myxillae]|uniref:helix-turn-helix domain-containing protein n=1 Tax=Flagellimonas myxillae TaxID=2942214 RepID=UPI00201F6F55|nr:helix-turn-helix transcriptional regulator [Muricauda myxillae]MCL6268107.1 helix-turn-helix transcriptional regulator [Muricauda myxillae]
MRKYLLIVLLFAVGFQLSAQKAISGYVNLGDGEDWKPMVYLSQVPVVNLGSESEAIPIAIADVQKNGFFEFDKKHFSDSNKIYRLHVERIRSILNDTLAKDITFMFSGKDRMEFKKGKRIFAEYSTTNQGNLEWQKLRTFENRLVSGLLSEEDGNGPRKGFIKDSLQILMVKLIGLKQLEEKQLLDRDISENPTYYLGLLDDLRESPIKASEYWFLEKKMAYLTQVGVQKDLLVSRWLNVVLIILLVALSIFAVKQRNRVALDNRLSRQEQNVKALILEGKTNKEIASELFISLNTVKTHITNIYSKLNIANRKELLQKRTGTST